MWTNNYSLDHIKQHANISPRTIIDWSNFCRDICAQISIKDNKKIGGAGHVVEIDESKFGKIKYHRGRRVDGVWVFGGIDRTTRETFFTTVEDRSAETLIPILLQNVKTDSTIYSDCWKSYGKLKEYFAAHKTVNHSLHFVRPDEPDVHTQNIESQWRSLKRNVLPRNGTSKNLLNYYFAQKCVYDRYLKRSDSKFHDFLEMIKEIYPLEKADVTPRKDLIRVENLDYIKHSLPPRAKRKLPFKTMVSGGASSTSHQHSRVTLSSRPLNLSYDSDFQEEKKKVKRTYQFPVYSDDSDMESDCEIIFKPKH